MMAPEQLRRIRTVMGWTQTEAAAKVGVAMNTWARWEEGLVKPHPLRVPVLEKLFRQAERRAAKRAGATATATEGQSAATGAA